MNASRIRATLLLVLTFAAGAAVGVAGDRLNLIPAVAEATEPGLETDRGEGRQRQTTIERFADDLGLTVEQRFEIEILLDYYRSSAQKLQAIVRPQYRALMDSVRTKIEAVLNDGQVEHYRGLLQEKYGPDRNRQRAPEYDQN